MMTAEQAVATAQERLQAKLPGFDINSILAILQAVLGLLGGGGCPIPTPAALRGVVTNPSLLNRLRLRIAIHRAGVRSWNVGQAADALLTVGAEANDDELTAFHGAVIDDQ